MNVHFHPIPFFAFLDRDFMFYFFIISWNQTVKPELVIKKQLAKVNSTSNTTCNVNLEHKKFIGE